jgi:ubiquitin carboxyl-terminal hydrolase 1
LNSVIQALASITELEDHLKEIKSTQTTIDEDQEGERGRSIIESLLEIINELNTPRDRKTVLRATKFIESLRANNASSSRLFNSSQQDAHELLMMILEAVEEEVDRAARLRSSASLGLAGLITHHIPTSSSSSSSSSSPSTNRKIQRSPFRGLMANRIACAACGFSAGIRHSPTDHLSITLPVCVSPHLPKHINNKPLEKMKDSSRHFF